jgi:hypothetical protein
LARSDGSLCFNPAERTLVGAHFDLTWLTSGRSGVEVFLG